MELSDDRLFELKLELVDVLLDAFDSLESLEFMVKRSLRTALNKIVQSVQSYETTVDKVVEWADSQGKLRALVIGASIRSPQNPRLTGFIDSNLQPLLALEPMALGEADLLLSLLKILRTVGQSEGFEQDIFSACRQTLSNIDTRAPKLNQQLNNRQLTTAVKWLIVLELLLITWPRDDSGQLHIALFARNLAQLTTGKNSSNLTQWLDELPPDIQPRSHQPISGPVVPQLYSEQPSETDLKTLSASFLITVEPFETFDYLYGVHGYVVTRLGDEDRFTKIESITLQEPTDKELSGYTLKHIETMFPEWLLQATDAIAWQGDTIRKYYTLDYPPRTEITVEFWLPFEQLGNATETWKIYGQPSRLKKLTRFVGKEYRVVVRCYDRFSDSEALSQLTETWQLINKTSDKNADAMINGSQGYDFLENAQWQMLSKQVRAAVLGPVLTCPICAQKYNQQREALFIWMLEEGIPLILWSRCLDLKEEQAHQLMQTMQKWLTNADQQRLGHLFEVVKQARGETSDYQFALWCDEPRRLIELKDFLEEDGRRLQA